jgi:hypothetical protein
MVKRSKDLVDYQNQIQVNSGFGFQTAINKSKEVQNQWATAIEKVSDGLMDTAKTIDESRAKGLAEEVQFEKDIETVIGEDGEEISKIKYKPIEKSGLIFRASQDKYDKIVLSRFRADVMNTVNEASQQISNEVKQENGTIDQFDAMINNRLNSLITELPSKFSAYIQPEIDSTIQSYGNTVQTNRIRFENKQNDLDAKNFAEDIEEKILVALNSNMPNLAKGTLEQFKDELPAYMENSEYASLNGKEQLKDLTALVAFGEVYGPFSGVGDFENQNLDTLGREIKNINNMLILVDGGVGNLQAPNGDAVKVTQAEFVEKMGALDASAKTKIRTMLTRKKALLSGLESNQDFLASATINANVQLVNPTGVVNNKNDLDKIGRENPDTFLAVANPYYNNTLGTKYDVNAPNYLQQVVAVMKTQKYLPPTQRDQFVKKMKNDVVFTRSILPQLAQLENDVLYTKNGIQVKNTYDNLGFSEAETNALDYLQTIRTFGNQQITDKDIKQAFRIGADGLPLKDIVNIQGTSFKSTEIDKAISKTLGDRAQGTFRDDFLSAFPLQKIKQYVVRQMNNSQIGEITVDNIEKFTNRAIDNAMANSYVGFSKLGISGDAAIKQDNIKVIDSFFVQNPIEDFYSLVNPFTKEQDISYQYKSILETAKEGYVNGKKLGEQDTNISIKDIKVVTLANDNSILATPTYPLYELMYIDDNDKMYTITREDGYDIVYDPLIEYEFMKGILKKNNSINTVEQAKVIRQAKLKGKTITAQDAEDLIDASTPDSINYKKQWSARSGNK